MKLYILQGFFFFFFFRNRFSEICKSNRTESTQLSHNPGLITYFHRQYKAGQIVWVLHIENLKTLQNYMRGTVSRNGTKKNLT